MINNIIDIARKYFSDFSIEQKIISDSSFENNKVYYYGGLLILDYIMTFGSISDFTRDWYDLILPEKQIKLLNFSKVYPIGTSSEYAVLFEYPIIIKSDFLIQKANPFLLDNVYKTGFCFYQILPK